jgi:redox-sensitive bicupin YhaK (pirin superfamily)
MITIVEAQRAPAGPAAMNLLAAPLDLETAPRAVGPFAVVAHHKMAAVAAGALPVDADVRPHPHIGLTAITYVLEGAITHRDSLGNRCELVAGDLGVTVAGRGVVHSERFERLRLLGGALDLVQLLLALPDGAEDVEGSFYRVAAGAAPTTAASGAIARWLLPTPPEVPAALPRATPTLLADVTAERDVTWSIPEVPERAIYILAGEVELGGHRARAGQVAVVGRGEVAVRSLEPARFLAFGGAPVGPRYSWWNYLHSSLDRIEAAKAEWRAGQVKLPVGDTESFTPAPPDDGRPLRRLNAP